jgi:lipid-binding SYLF domain-containing protein
MPGVKKAAFIVGGEFARGLFAGFDLSGGVLRPDNDASRDFYGHAVVNREVLLGGTREPMPAAANPFIAALSGAPRSGANRPNAN